MSKHITSNIESILTNIAGQKANIEANLAAATEAALVHDDGVQNAINILVDRYQDVQAIGKIIGAQMALEKLRVASGEVAVLEAALKAAIDDTHFVAKIQQQMTADVIREAANS